ncbi:TonB-dependent receptor [Flavobacterium sp.]|uniref:SusC/RagA family TonB-linked outer membrane protein n=1 Tax=Flavobacterium sp. TaxID=239 RepID=UPI0032645971
MNFKDLLNKGANCCFAFVILLCLLSSNQVSAQGVTLEGVVKDASGLTLPGVNVLEKGTKNGVSTDFDGKYKLKLSNPKATVVFSYIGFKTKEVAAAGKNKIDVSLADESNTLNEVVVVGYGTVKKSDLTGAVATLSGNDLRKNPVASVAEALTGRLAGVNVTSSEGSPDSEIKIRIRGGGSLTQDSSPLIIVDGFPVNSLSDISSSDIESTTVLKDASSTAIYGSRGANGVIIVTTKKGKDGKLQVNFNTFYGMKTLANEIDAQSPEDFVKWQYEYSLLKDDNADSYEEYFGKWQDYDLYQGLKGNNWQKQIYGRTGEVQSRDLGIRGGSEKINFNFNYAHYDEKAIMIGSNYKRDNLSFAVNNKASDKIDLSFTMRYSDTDINGGGNNEVNDNPADSRLKHVVGYSPIPMPGLTTNDTEEANSSYLVNPFIAVADSDRQQQRKNYNMLGSFSWKIIENLQLKTDLGLDNYNYLDYRFYGRSTFYSRNTPAIENRGAPTLVMTDRKDYRFRNANTLNYDFKKILGKNHDLKILAGEEMIDSRRNDVNTTVEGLPNFFDLDKSIHLTSQGSPRIVDNYYFPDDKLLSFFGRLNYDYKDRYLFTATYRADGSSKFLGDNKWGYFPAAAVAWKISEESFLKDVSWVNSLKVRLSYGEAGNNNIPTGQTAQSFEANNSTWINGQGNYWAPSGILANPDLKWETTVTQNAGLDFDFFKGRINGSLEMYKNVTKDLLINFPVSGTGYSTQYRNMGETQNTGFEATLNIAAIEKKDYGLNFSFNIGVNKNRINSLGSLSDFYINTDWTSSSSGTSNDFAVKVGSPIGLMNGFKSDGRYEVSDFDYVGGEYVLKAGIADDSEIVGDAQPGDMKLKDLNGDGKVTVEDKTIIGNANPKYTGGFVLNANAYGFDLSAAFNFSVGNDVYNANKVEFTTSTPQGQYRNLSSQVADGSRWTNIDSATGALVTDSAALTALNTNTTMWSPYMSRFVFSDWAVEDGSFLRLNTLTLGYTSPQALVSKLGVSKLRFYFTANNVFVLTNYSGPDPEVSTRRRTPLTPGVDYSAYPRSRQLIFGVNLNF